MLIVLTLIGLFVVYIYLIVPVQIRDESCLAIDIPFVELDPEDDRIPTPIRNRFHMTGVALQGLGYAKVATLTQSVRGGNYTLFISMFGDLAKGDHAFIFETVCAELPELGQQIVHFSSDVENASADVGTSNAAILAPFSQSSVGDSWIFPGMTDINLLHRLHKEHRKLSTRRPFGPAEPIIDYCEAFTRRGAGVRQYFVSRGYYREDRDSNELRITWPACYLAAWGQTTPILQIRRWLMRRKANKILRQLGFPTKYATESLALEAAKHDKHPMLAETTPDTNATTEPETIPD